MSSSTNEGRFEAWLQTITKDLNQFTTSCDKCGRLGYPRYIWNGASQCKSCIRYAWLSWLVDQKLGPDNGFSGDL